MDKKQYNKIYREKNKEVLRAYDKAYYEKHIELKKAQKLVYHNKLKDTPEYRAKRKKYYEENRQEIQKANKEYKSVHRKRYAELGRLSRERKLGIQAGRARPSNCEVCGSPDRIHFDHDHATGKFRGWICHNCNITLGHSRDNVEVLYKLINYLNHSRGLTTIANYIMEPQKEVAGLDSRGLPEDSCQAKEAQEAVDSVC